MPGGRCNSPVAAHYVMPMEREMAGIDAHRPPVQRKSAVAKFSHGNALDVQRAGNIFSPSSQKIKPPIHGKQCEWRFVNEWNVHGPAHHCAVGVGHFAGKIEKLGSLLGIELVCICRGIA